MLSAKCVCVCAFHFGMTSWLLWVVSHAHSSLCVRLTKSSLLLMEGTLMPSYWKPRLPSHLQRVCYKVLIYTVILFERSLSHGISSVEMVIPVFRRTQKRDQLAECCQITASYPLIPSYSLCNQNSRVLIWFFICFVFLVLHNRPFSIFIIFRHKYHKMPNIAWELTAWNPTLHS